MSNIKEQPVILPKQGRGYYGIGVYLSKFKKNIGSLFRTAFILNAQYIFTIGQRYDLQKSDTVKAYRNIPLFQYNSFEEFYSTIPKDCKLIGIELCDRSVPLTNFVHPERCIYLLGAEDYGLPKKHSLFLHNTTPLSSIILMLTTRAHSEWLPMAQKP